MVKSPIKYKRKCGSSATFFILFFFFIPCSLFPPLSLSLTRILSRAAHSREKNTHAHIHTRTHTRTHDTHAHATRVYTRTRARTSKTPRRESAWYSSPVIVLVRVVVKLVLSRLCGTTGHPSRECRLLRGRVTASQWSVASDIIYTRDRASCSRLVGATASSRPSPGFQFGVERNTARSVASWNDDGLRPILVGRGCVRNVGTSGVDGDIYIYIYIIRSPVERRKKSIISSFPSADKYGRIGRRAFHDASYSGFGA